MKRFLACIMAVIFAVGLVPAAAFAEAGALRVSVEGIVGEQAADKPEAVEGDASENVFALAAAEAFVEDDGFVDIAADVHIVPLSAGFPDAVEAGLSAGAVLGGFSLAIDPVVRSFDYAEVTVRLSDGVSKGDIVELRHEDAAKQTWGVYGYYQVVDLSERVTGFGETARAASGLGFTFEIDGGGETGAFAVVDKSTVDLSCLTAVESMPGDDESARFWKCFRAGGAYASTTGTTGIVTHHYADTPDKAGSSLEMRGMNICRKDGGDTGIITYIYADERPNEIYFEGCHFEGVGFKFSVSGTYAFVNCTFTGCTGIGLETRSDDARVFAYGCTFEDNAPDKEVWNANAHDERHSEYAAIRLRGNRASLHAAGCTFKNLQTDSVVITRTNYDTKSNYDGMTFVYERNVMVDCGGAGVVIDNPVRGRVDGNTFTNIGAMRGMNGYKSTIHPTRRDGRQAWSRRGRQRRLRPRRQHAHARAEQRDH